MQYSGCCNEFWWCLNNVAKGIARDELSYSMLMFNHIVRDMLIKMLEWYIGVQNGFELSSGKLGKHFKKYLPEEYYRIFAKTYSDSDYDHLWTAIFTACDLFRTIANIVAEYFGYEYNKNDDDGMMKYLNMVKND
ncbi:MAG: aminoglycoside 6-adenylyltransferase [Oscillospiraceae bacterium]|nr:aminoglycoside 6-adenylyltransferase [Oscillospiraceae bacterium]